MLFEDLPVGGHLGYLNRMILAILNLCGPNASHQVWAQSDIGFLSRCGFKIFNFGSLFVCVEVLQPSQPNGVMSGAVSLPNHKFTGQA